MTRTALNDQFAVCTPEEEEVFCAIDKRQEDARQAAEKGIGPIQSQRERFEAKCAYYPWMLPMQRWESTGEYVNLETRRAWNLWQAACPDGWQAVPVDPSAGMLTALWKSDPFERYSAMLDAAPMPEDVCLSKSQMK